VPPKIAGEREPEVPRYLKPFKSGHKNKTQTRRHESISRPLDGLFGQAAMPVDIKKDTLASKHGLRCPYHPMRR